MGGINFLPYTAQKTKFFIKDFFCKCAVIFVQYSHSYIIVQYSCIHIRTIFYIFLYFFFYIENRFVRPVQRMGIIKQCTHSHSPPSTPTHPQPLSPTQNNAPPSPTHPTQYPTHLHPPKIMPHPPPRTQNNISPILTHSK